METFIASKGSKRGGVSKACRLKEEEEIFGGGGEINCEIEEFYLVQSILSELLVYMLAGIES